jgi:hypothetical protein
MNWLRKIYNRIKLELVYRKKLKETHKKDPYVYK